MHPLNSIAELTLFAGKNIAYNLGFLPEDKLQWKPAETAKSALEITHEVCYFLTGLVSVFNDGKWTDPQVAPFSNLAEAQVGVTGVTEAFAGALRSVDPARLSQDVVLPFGTFSLGRIAGMGVVESIHHHGQIAYIQTLLGDTVSHFYEMGS